MNDRPLTWFLVTALGLWGLWLWRTKRLAAPVSGAAEPTPGAAEGKPASYPGPGPSAYGMDSLARMLT